MCALGWGGRTKKRMNALLHKITSTCVFIRDCIQGSENIGITGILAELDEKYWNTVLTTLTMDS